MLAGTKLRNLKPRDRLYKVNGRDALYVVVTKAGSISFRYNYSINGRQETITFGRYGVGGIMLAEARIKGAEIFNAWAQKWLRSCQMADTTRDMRRSVC